MPFKIPQSSVRPGVLAALLPIVSLFAAPPAAASAPRVVVLGFDGADHALVKKMIEEGKLPNLAALAKKGGFSQLLPTIPAQTPVSWSTFSTGLSPGRTMIFDFLKRNPKTYRPEFAIAEEGKKNFLLGTRNRVGIPAVLGLLAFVVVAGLLKILLRRRVRGLGAGARRRAVSPRPSSPSWESVFLLFSRPRSPSPRTTAAGRRSGSSRVRRGSTPSSCTCP